MPEKAADVWQDGSRTEKFRIRAWGLQVETGLSAAGSGAGWKDTKAILDADLEHDADTIYWVGADSTPANNGIYVKSGASGSGSWVRKMDLPMQLINMIVTGGTANAITATAPVSFPTAPFAALFTLQPTEANTGAVTVAVNGGSPVAVTDYNGNTLTSGYFADGKRILLVWNGASFQSATDLNAEYWAASAAASAALATSAAVRFFDSVAAMVADVDLLLGQNVVTRGYHTAGDGGGNTYQVVASGTGSADGGLYIDLTGSGLQARGLFPAGMATPKQWGAYANRGAGNTDDTAFLAAFDAASLPLGVERVFDPAKHYTASNYFNPNSIIPTTKLKLPSSSITLGTSDDLAALLPRMPRDQIVIFPNKPVVDPWTTAGLVTIKDPIRLQAQNTGGCGWSVPIAFEQSGGKSWMEGFDIVPRTDYSAVTIDGSGTFYLDNLKGTAGAIAAATPFRSFSGNIYFRALSRSCIFDYTASTNDVPLCEFNYLTNVWMSTGGGSSYYGWWKGPNLSTWLLTFTMSTGYMHNWRVDGGGKTGLSLGVLLQRGAKVRFGQDSGPGTGLGLQNLLKGLQATTGARAYISGAGSIGTDRFYIASNGTGLDTQGGGKIVYETATTLFSGNTTNTVSGAAAHTEI